MQASLTLWVLRDNARLLAHGPRLPLPHEVDPRSLSTLAAYDWPSSRSWANPSLSVLQMVCVCRAAQRGLGSTLGTLVLTHYCSDHPSWYTTIFHLLFQLAKKDQSLRTYTHQRASPLQLEILVTNNVEGIKFKLIHWFQQGISLYVISQKVGIVFLKNLERLRFIFLEISFKMSVI